jgi:hypothetical protein
MLHTSLNARGYFNHLDDLDLRHNPAFRWSPEYSGCKIMQAKAPVHKMNFIELINMDPTGLINNPRFNPDLLDCPAIKMKLNDASMWYLSSNPAITWDTYIKHADLNWRFTLLLNPNVRYDQAKTMPSFKKTYSWNPNVTIEDVNRSPGGWCWMGLATNIRLTIADIKRNIDDIGPEAWTQISANIGIKFEDLGEIEHLSIVGFSQNYNLRVEHLSRATGWSWNHVSMNPGIKLDDILNNTRFPFNWDFVSMNPSIDMDQVEKYIYLPWSWYHLSKNPNLTLAFFNRHSHEEWDFNGIMLNKLSYDRYFQSETYRRPITKLVHDRLYEELIATSCTPRRILQWNESTTEPDHPFYGMTQADIDSML